MDIWDEARVKFSLHGTNFETPDTLYIQNVSNPLIIWNKRIHSFNVLNAVIGFLPLHYTLVVQTFSFSHICIIQSILKYTNGMVSLIYTKSTEAIEVKFGVHVLNLKMLMYFNIQIHFPMIDSFKLSKHNPHDLQKIFSCGISCNSKLKIKNLLNKLKLVHYILLRKYRHSASMIYWTLQHI